MLTEEEALHIRWLLDTKKASAASIARMYLLGVETVRRIGRRESWNHLPEAAALKSEDALATAAQASLEKLRQEHPELFPVGMTARMAVAAAGIREQAVRGDKLIEELKGDASGTSKEG